MQDYKKIGLLLFAVLVMIVAAAMAALPSRGQHDPLSNSAAQRAEGSQEPVAEYAAPEPADPERRARRRAIGRRYDGQGMVREPHSTAGDTSRIASWLTSLPALPVAQSNAVVIGEITDTQASLSNDKTGVYTEFTVRIDEVLKNDDSALLVPSGAIDAIRMGGRVRFPSGRVQRYTFFRQGMPRVGRRYVLFLQRIDQEQAFSILTGYELRAGRVYPLDGVDVPGGGSELPQFAAWKEADELTLLNSVREVIVRQPQALPKGGG